MTPPKILLVTLNASYFHCAFGLRYLYANLKEFRSETRLLEFTNDQSPRDVAEALLALNPKLVGFGVYIWNSKQTYEVVSILKRVRPDLVVVLGGPEVSHDCESQSLCQLANVTIRGEGDLLFYEVCRDYLSENKLPASRWISAELPDVRSIESPYPYYSAEDIQRRVIYVEASRGCPFKCEFCLSSLDKAVRGFDLDRFLAEMESLIQRGARKFKFVDRTFNLSIASSARILRFFLGKKELGLFLHFEMIPDRLPLELRDLIRQFPPGSLQLEIGIQTWNPEVGKLVSRRQDYDKVRDNFHFLIQETSVHIHADLIAGLPGENLESFGAGFDALAELNPHEIQVGILKRLKGTPIVRHDASWEMIYQEEPPFSILSTKTMPFEELQRMVRFSKFWDLCANSGNFPHTLALFRKLSQTRQKPSLFWEFHDLATFLSHRHPQRHGIALLSLVESLWVYLTEVRLIPVEDARAVLVLDYTGFVKRDVPAFLREPGAAVPRSRRSSRRVPSVPPRQQRHLAGNA